MVGCIAIKPILMQSDPKVVTERLGTLWKTVALTDVSGSFIKFDTNKNVEIRFLEKMKNRTCVEL